MQARVYNYQLKKLMIEKKIDYVDDNGYNEIFKEDMTKKEERLHEKLLVHYYEIVRELVDKFNLEYGYINYIILEDNELVASIEEC